jgi:hypothetical protein
MNRFFKEKMGYGRFIVGKHLSYTMKNAELVPVHPIFPAKRR